MKLISMEHGQTLQNFQIEELRPLQGLYMPDFIRSITERYNFISPPEMGAVEKEGAKFKNGKLVNAGKTIHIRNFDFFKDGIIVITHNTQDSDFIITDALTWAQSS